MSGVAESLAEAARLRREGRVGEARRVLEGVLAQEPNHPEAAHQLAGLLMSAGSMGEAALVAARAAAAHRSDVRLAVLYAFVLRSSGRGREADAELERARALASGPGTDAGARVLAGRALMNAGRVREGAVLLGEALRLEPNNREARVHSASAMITLGRISEAVKFAEASLVTDPDSHELHFQLATALRLDGRLDEAEAHYERSIELSGGTHQTAGRDERPVPEPVGPTANTQFDAARGGEKEGGGYGPAVAGLVAVHESRGDFARAGETAERSLRAGSMDPLVAVAFARHARRSGRQRDGIAALRRVLGSGNPGEGGAGARARKPAVFYTLGALHEDLGEYDAAWDSYRSANELHPRTFTAEADRAETAGLMRVFSAEAIARLAACPQRFEEPVFVLGLPRSGTTLIEQIIASHPRAFGGGELREMGRIATTIRQRFALTQGFPACASELTPDQLGELAREHVEYLRRLSRGEGAAASEPSTQTRGAGGSEGEGREGGAEGAARVTDKMPPNYKLIGLIAMVLPGARIINCIRDPLDNIVSILATPLSAAHGYAYDPGDAAEHLRNYRRLMEHWRSVFGTVGNAATASSASAPSSPAGEGREGGSSGPAEATPNGPTRPHVHLMDVVYEDVVHHPEREARRIIEFVGLEWNDACLRFHETKREVRTASVDQVRKPIYDSSIGRWKRFERHLGGLVAEFGRADASR